MFTYYRWADAPSASCEIGAESGVEIHLTNQPREWSAIGATDRARTRYFTNGLQLVGPIFAPPEGTGSQTYGGFTDFADAFPFHYSLQLDTLEAGTQLVYRSALTATCTGPGTPYGRS